MAQIKIPYIAWRDDRPRFKPGNRERALGFKDQDLKHDDGRWFTLDETRRWAKAKQQEIATARQNGRREMSPTAAPGRRLCDLLHDWLKSPAVLRLSPKTQDGYRKQINAIIFRPLKSEKEYAAWLTSPELTRLDPKVQAQYITSVTAYKNRRVKPEPTREPFGLSPVKAIGTPEIYAFLEYQAATRGLHMARASRAVIQAAFSWGRKSIVWRLPNNPADDLGLENPEERIVIWSDAEIRHIIAGADMMGRPSIGDSIMLGLFTGQRQGDRLALEDAGLVDGRRKFRQSKTGAVVTIKETPQLTLRLDAARVRVAELALRYGLDKEKRPSTVLVCESTGQAWNQNTYANNFARLRAAAAAGVLDEEATTQAREQGRSEPVWRLAPMPTVAEKRDQDLRDTSVTWLARAGSTLPEIAGVTGHSLASIHNIMKHYLQISPELGDAAIDKLVAWMEREGIAVS